jgi:ribosomal protein L13E
MGTSAAFIGHQRRAAAAHNMVMQVGRGFALKVLQNTGAGVTQADARSSGRDSFY